VNTSILTSAQQLFVQQRKEWIEIVVDFETFNQYRILDADKHEVGTVIERGGQFWTKVKRFFLRSHRPFKIDVFDASQSPLLHLSRDFFFFFSDLLVSGAEGQKIGAVHRRFGIIYKRYDLRDVSGRTFARIKSPLWRLWTFPVLDELGEQRSAISKRWGGALKEIFTDTDTFQVDFGQHTWTPEQRAIIFSAAISVDFDFFENQQGNRGGLLNWG
jgi:uncharacterized protein YxjI